MDVPLCNKEEYEYLEEACIRCVLLPSEEVQHDAFSLFAAGIAARLYAARGPFSWSIPLEPYETSRALHIAIRDDNFLETDRLETQHQSVPVLACLAAKLIDMDSVLPFIRSMLKRSLAKIRSPELKESIDWRFFDAYINQRLLGSDHEVALGMLLPSEVYASVCLEELVFLIRRTASKVQTISDPFLRDSWLQKIRSSIYDLQSQLFYPWLDSIAQLPEKRTLLSCQEKAQLLSQRRLADHREEFESFAEEITTASQEVRRRLATDFKTTDFKEDREDVSVWLVKITEIFVILRKRVNTL